MTASAVVFDIGGVLVDWQPHLAWMKSLGTRAKVDEFMDRIDFITLNARADAGESFTDLAAEIDDPTDKARLADYVSFYTHTVPSKIAGTWGIVADLRLRNVPLHAITNWSAETWPEGVKVHPELDQIFGTLVVSGREGVAKPDARIFEILCERAGLSPSDCIFIDDGLHNVEAARKVGMTGIHFTDAEALRSDLSKQGLL